MEIRYDLGVIFGSSDVVTQMTGNAMPIFLAGLFVLCVFENHHIRIFMRRSKAYFPTSVCMQNRYFY